MSRRDRRGGRPSLWLLITLLLLAVGQSSALAAESGLIRLDVTIGKSQVLNLQEPFTRVSVTNPAIADVFVVTPNQILINGKSVGVTSLVVFYPTKTVFFDLLVQTDLAPPDGSGSSKSPRATTSSIHPAQDAIILDGTVSSDRTIAGAVEVAQVFAPKGKVVSLLSLTDAKPQQVLLQVHVAEVDRSALKELGFSFRALGTAFMGAAFPGSRSSARSGAWAGHPGRLPWGRRRLAVRSGLPVQRRQPLPLLGTAGLCRHRPCPG